MQSAILGIDGHGILLAGPGGSGKSGTTLAGLAHGLSTVGDDYVMVDLNEGPFASRVYRMVKQDAAGVARIPGLGARLGERRTNWQGKFEFDPDGLFPGAVRDRMRLHGILLPSRGGGDRSALEPVSRPGAVRLLSEAMSGEAPAQKVEALLFVVALTLHLPTYRMRLSTDPAEIASTVRSFIEARLQ